MEVEIPKNPTCKVTSPITSKVVNLVAFTMLSYVGSDYKSVNLQ